MFKMWTLHPHYIDNAMLLDVYFSGIKLLKVFEGQSRFTRDEQRYYPAYFMYDMLNSHPQKLVLLARYLFWISEVLKFQRNMEVDISELPLKSIWRTNSETPIKLFVPSQLVIYERETMEKRLDKIRRVQHQNLVSFPASGAQTNPVIEIVVGDMTPLMKQQVCDYQIGLADYTEFIQQNYPQL